MRRYYSIIFFWYCFSCQSKNFILLIIFFIIFYLTSELNLEECNILFYSSIFWLIGKETYQIREYVHDQVIAHCTAFGLIDNDPKEDINDLINFYELENSNRLDTIQIAIFFLEKTSTKKYIIMSALFRKILLKQDYWDRECIDHPKSTHCKVY